MKWPFQRNKDRYAAFDLGGSHYGEEHALLEPFREAAWAWRDAHGTSLWYGELRNFPGAGQALDRRGPGAAVMIVAIGEQFASQRRGDSSYCTQFDGINQLWTALANRLFVKKPLFTSAQLTYLVNLSEEFLNVTTYFDPPRLARVALNVLGHEGMGPQLARTSEAIIKRFEQSREAEWAYKEERMIIAKLKLALAGEDPNQMPLNEPWQHAFLTHADRSLLEHAGTARGLSPSAKWIKSTQEKLAPVGGETFLEAFEAAIAAIRKMDVPVDSLHSDMLRGLCWMAGQIKTQRAAFLLGEMLLACNHKLSGVGVRSQKGFSACVTALEQFGETYALAELSKARAKVKTPSLAQQLFKSLNAAARKQGVPLAELEELILPTFGLDSPGMTKKTFGDVEAELRIVGTTDVELNWTKAGKPVKSVPASVKEAHKVEVSDLSKRKKEIEAALSAQKQRLESLFMTERSWPFPLWRERHIDHPLMANMTRRLIWIFSTRDGDVLGICPEGTPVDLEDRPIQGLDESATVRLWHPLDAGVSAVEAWREYLVVHEIQQPFKQAHREVYLLTDAERTTNVYSNRFAAHLLKQHQAAALMRTRGWRYALQGYFDAYNTPKLLLPEYELEVQFFIEVPGDYDDSMATEAGIALYVSTDQVRFVRAGTDDPVPLHQVPRKVFSESLRDVDLFVGVSSVGNDPTWMDGGPARYTEYWSSFAFGDLSATAETRKAILQRLLPKLAIASVSRIEGKFLVVKGTQRTYKIHLGSGNILMEPNDQYLCIVPSRGDDTARREELYLPFEGDRTMAVILSKALMLAEDDKIKDPTILSQLRRS